MPTAYGLEYAAATHMQVGASFLHTAPAATVLALICEAKSVVAGYLGHEMQLRPNPKKFAVPIPVVQLGGALSIVGMGQ